MSIAAPIATSAPAPRFSFLKKMLLVFAVILIALIAIVMLQPEDFRVWR